VSEIGSLESKILLPKINLQGRVTLAIRTKHLSNIGSSPLLKAPLQTCDVLSLRRMARQADVWQLETFS
jgi:hypothetical protein